MPSETALRELKEEVGLSVNPADLDFVHSAYREKHNETGDRIDVFFQVTRWSGQVSNPEPHKCGGWEWHDLNSLPVDLIPYLKEILSAVAQGKRYSEHKHCPAGR